MNRDGYQDNDTNEIHENEVCYSALIECLADLLIAEKTDKSIDKD